MSEENQSKGRGRGRWKDATPNERVAQWVNQREARRQNKLRWAAREQEAQTEKEKDDACAEIPNTEEMIEKNRSKRNPQVQLYVPPSLRGEQRTPCTAKGQRMVESEESKSEVVSTTRKGRGRGRRKPEQEVYVPRALREKNKAAAEREMGSGDGQSVSKKIGLEMSVDTKPGVGTDLNMDHHSSMIREQGEETIIHADCPQQSAASQWSSDNNTHMSSPEPDFNQSVDAGKNTEVENSSLSASSPICLPPSLDLNSCTPFSENSSADRGGAETYSHDSVTQAAVQDTNKPIDKDGVETSQTPICSEESFSSHTNMPPDNPYTFEFYDPAVIAFMPSSPNQEAPNITLTNQLLEGNTISPTSASQSEDNQQHKVQNLTTNIQCGTCLSPPLLSSGPLSEGCDQFQGDKATYLSTTVTSKDSDHVLKAGMNQEFRPAPKSTEALNEIKSNDVPGEEEDEGDSWDTMFDDNGDCIDESLMDELVQNVGKVGIDQPKINYLKFEPKQTDIDVEAFSHIVEIYDFSPELATCDLISAFRDFASRGFDVRWVDDTHALGVFSSAVAASEALRMIHPMLKVRPMSQASKQGLNKAKHCQEFLQPYKARPETTSLAARRLVAGALGMAPKVSREVRDKERQKLKEAKEKRRQERQQKVDVWDGSFGKCAMDDV